MEERCCFDDWTPHWEKRSRKKPTVAPITKTLLEELGHIGLEGKTILDVGCGIGDLPIEAVRMGATRASGFDLSPKAIEGARRLAQRRGVSDRTSFEVGDGSDRPLPEADVVTLNRVICCYPHVEALLDRTLAAAGSIFAYTAPPSDGVLGATARAFARLSNIWYMIRRSRFGDFRVFVHDLEAVDTRIQAAGFRRRRLRRRREWNLAVYSR
jgi:magnesium-protoporphyrin O-methyltransferase